MGHRTDKLGLSMGTIFANCTSYGEGEREALATLQRVLDSLNQATTNSDFFGDNQDCHELSELAEQVVKYTEVVKFGSCTHSRGCQTHRQARKLQLMTADGMHTGKSQ